MIHVLGGVGDTSRTVEGYKRSSFVLRVDPRSRVLAAVSFAVTVVALQDFFALAIALGLSVCAMIDSRLPVGRTLKRMAAMDGFIVFMLAMLPFTVPGQTMFTLFGWNASWEGLYQAIEIGLTANSVVLMLMALVGSMESTTLCHALHRLKVPEALVHLLMFTVRYIDVLYQEYRRLRTAMTARGFRPGNNRHTYRMFGYLVGMMLVRALERSERVLGAMKCRGFSGRIHVIDDMVFTRTDVGFGLTVLIVIAGLVLMDWTHVASY